LNRSREPATLLGTGPIWSRIQDLTKATELPTFDATQRKFDAVLDRKLKNYRC